MVIEVLTVAEKGERGGHTEEKEKGGRMRELVGREKDGGEKCR